MDRLEEIKYKHFNQGEITWQDVNWLISELLMAKDKLNKNHKIDKDSWWKDDDCESDNPFMPNYKGDTYGYDNPFMPKVK